MLSKPLLLPVKYAILWYLFKHLNIAGRWGRSSMKARSTLPCPAEPPDNVFEVNEETMRTEKGDTLFDLDSISLIQPPDWNTKPSHQVLELVAQDWILHAWAQRGAFEPECLWVLRLGLRSNPRLPSKGTALEFPQIPQFLWKFV